ncbi:MAG: helicase-related protein [bacterium]
MIIPDIIDNSAEGHRLADVLKEILVPGTRVFIASGYFNLGGFSLIKERLKGAQGVRLLLGRALSPQDVRSAEIFLEVLREEAEAKMGNPETEDLIHEFLRWLDHPSVEVKIYKRGFYHGKFYILEEIPVLGALTISGSSNFTEAGLTSNTEFNTVLKQGSAVREAKQVFTRLWNESEDYKEDLKSLYSDFTTAYTPHEIYIKALYAYFRDKFASVSPTDEIPSPIVLTDFQRDGYLAALDTLDRYGGVLLSDSVGLGKTYLALKLLDDFAYRLRQKALIICPAQLKGILWEPKLRDAGIRADIVHRERVSRKDFPIAEYEDHELIVVDESHNFRNSQTNCWKNLSSCVIRGKPKKVILITATPLNNSVFDLYNQIRLITGGRDDFFAPAGISSLRSYFLRADKEKEALYDLLEEIAVRRSRPFIKKNYPDAAIDGEPIRFPERELHTARYNLEETYQGLYKECSQAIENLTLASYNVESYRKEIRQEQLGLFEEIRKTLLAEGWSDKEAKDFLWKLGRNEAVIAILKMLFLKRLESSIEAFRISIERLVDFQRKFLQVFKEGRMLDRDAYRKFFFQSGEDESTEEEEDISTVLERLPQINLEDFDVEGIKHAVGKDIDALEQIHKKVERIRLGKDVKLKTLKEKLSGELKGRKVIIFSYFKDTARYLYRWLGGNREWLERRASFEERGEVENFLKRTGLSSQTISITDSGIDPHERKGRIMRFSPVANDRPELKGTEKEIQILISTDVLSEGQNLQDADTVINHDLPWNPVRLIQRVGRVDRLKSPHPLVHLYNFFPEDALESLLGILERLYEKLDAINRSVGLDVSTLGEIPTPKDFGYIRDLFAGKAEVLEELEGMSELAIGEFLKQELLQFLEKMGEERIRRIPNGVGSGLRVEGQRGLFMAFEDKERHYWCYYDLKTGKTLENKLQVIRLIRCEESEPRIEPDFDVYEIIEKAKRHILARLRTSSLKPPMLKAPQNQIVNWLQGLGSKATDLLEYFREPLPDLYLRELRSLWINRASSEEVLILKLREFKEAHPTSPAMERTPLPEEQELKLVCYLAVVS